MKYFFLHYLLLFFVFDSTSFLIGDLDTKKTHGTNGSFFDMLDQNSFITFNFVTHKSLESLVLLYIIKLYIGLLYIGFIILVIIFFCMGRIRKTRFISKIPCDSYDGAFGNGEKLLTVLRNKLHH